jgi:hypothetical protein
LFWQFLNKIEYFRYFCSKAEKLCRLSFTYVLRSLALFNGDFCINLYSVDSDEAMKRGDEVVNASSLQFLGSVKRFIASSLQYFTQR